MTQKNNPPTRTFHGTSLYDTFFPRNFLLLFFFPFAFPFRQRRITSSFHSRFFCFSRVLQLLSRFRHLVYNTPATSERIPTARRGLEAPLSRDLISSSGGLIPVGLVLTDRESDLMAAPLKRTPARGQRALAVPSHPRPDGPPQGTARQTRLPETFYYKVIENGFGKVYARDS